MPSPRKVKKAWMIKIGRHFFIYNGKQYNGLVGSSSDFPVTITIHLPKK